MPGRFNIENALAAIVIAKLNNIDDKSIEIALEETKVEGRMNIYKEKGITVIVDYAHNGYSFSKLFESIKMDYPNRKIISVGGIVGGKAFNRRREFVTAVRLFETLSAISSCLRENSSRSLLYACASSIGFKSSLWMFSIREISTTSSSENSLTITGISFNPAIFAARHLRSPAMIS